MTNNVERLHDRDSCRQFLGGSAFEAGEAIHGDNLCPVPSRHACGRAFNQVAKTRLERPSTMSRRRDRPVLSRAGVRSMITVTYLSPRRVCRQTCSSAPMIFTPLKRTRSTMSTRHPSAKTAWFAVFHEAPSPSATRATVRCWPTMPSSAQRSPRRENFVLGQAAFDVFCRHTCPHTDQQCGGPPTEGFMDKLPGHRVPRNALAAALRTPRIRFRNTAGNLSTITSQELPRRFKTKIIKAAESSQVREMEGSVVHEGPAVERSRSRQSDSRAGPSSRAKQRARSGIRTPPHQLHPGF